MNLSSLSSLTLATVFEEVGIGLTIVGSDAKVQWANGRAVELLGWREGQGLDSVLKCHPKHLHHAVSLRIQHAKAKEWHRVLELDGKFLENLYFPIEIEGSRGILIVTQDVTERESAARELQRVATTDGLTGLFNRQYLSRFLENPKLAAEVAGAIVVDVNGLKHINDNYGHSAGDRLLRMTAEVLLSCVRRADMVFRIGGDEFLILVSDDTSASVLAVAERVMGRSDCRLFGQADCVCLSVGFALLESPSQLERCINLADHHMYDNKRRFYQELQ